jgi:hypothetical protein
MSSYSDASMGVGVWSDIARGRERCRKDRRNPPDPGLDEFNDESAAFIGPDTTY